MEEEEEGMEAAQAEDKKFWYAFGICEFQIKSKTSCGELVMILFLQKQT